MDYHQCTHSLAKLKVIGSDALRDTRRWNSNFQKNRANHFCRLHITLNHYHDFQILHNLRVCLGKRRR